MSDLFDFFKEQESKLHERPSEQVWQKLQGRLENSRRQRRRGIRFLQLGTVALILLLLLLAAVLVWYFVERHARQGAIMPVEMRATAHPDGAAPATVPAALRDRFTWLIGEWKRREGRTERTLVWEWSDTGLLGRYTEQEGGSRPFVDEYTLGVRNGEITCGRTSGLPPEATLPLLRDDGSTFVFMREIQDTYHEIAMQRVGPNVMLLRQLSRNPQFLAPGTQWYFTRVAAPGVMGSKEE